MQVYMKNNLLYNFDGQKRRLRSDIWPEIADQVKSIKNMLKGI